MPYRFTFDLRKLPREFFQEVTRLAYEAKLHKRLGSLTRSIIRKFRVQELTGLNLDETIALLEDLIEIQALNVMNKEKFGEIAGEKALFLPHCARKYMDSRCKAEFDPKIPTYRCRRCSPDCLINKAVTIAERKGYDVYIVPGGSCIPKILASHPYKAVVGVACGMELMLGYQLVKQFGLIAQGLPLLKNGCANTWFDVEELAEIL